MAELTAELQAARATLATMENGVYGFYVAFPRICRFDLCSENFEVIIVIDPRCKAWSSLVC